MNLHQQLAEAQRAQRDAEDTFKLVKAITEQRAIDAVSGSYGKNADERERFLILALAGDTNYARALVRLRRAEQAVDQLKAALATQEDDRRAYEWPVRAALVEALGARREPFDAAMDEAVDCATMRRDFINALSGLDNRANEVPYAAFADDVEEVFNAWYKHD
jgi:hypothetical protein